MSRAQRGKKSGKKDEEVEEILEAAEALMLLRLTTDSHLARSSGDSLGPELASRFNALKAPPGTAAKPSPPPPLPRPAHPKAAGATALPDEEMKRILGDDLSARFAALKGSSSSAVVSGVGDLGGRDLDEKEGGSEESDVDEEGVSKKEVEKVMQWAFDAARLDPSLSDDEDALDLDKSDGDVSTASDEDDDFAKRNRVKAEKKKKKRFFF